MAGAPALTLAVLAVAVAAGPVTDQEMRVETGRLFAAVSGARRLPPGGAIERHLVTRAEAVAARDEAVAARALDAELAGRARVWARLGLLPAGADARRAAQPLDGTPTASYDLMSHRLSVPDWLPLAQQRTALTHALAHALADQRFGLRQTLGIGLDGRHALDSDAERARLALVEGDADATTLELADARGAFTGSHALAALAARLRVAPAGDAARTPAWTLANAAFAHADGLLFVGRVRARESWGAVDALWADPPQSSEQVLHPEKYDARDRPVAVILPRLRAVGGDYREAGADVLGELGVRTWLEAAVPAEIAARAAAGWGGDRAVVFESLASPPATDAGAASDVGAASPSDGAAPATDAGVGPVSFVVWSTVWDDVTDADDFARVAVVALAHLEGADEPPALDSHGRALLRAGDLVDAVAVKGAAVALLVGAPEAALPALDEILARPPRIPARAAPARAARPGLEGAGAAKR